MADHEHCSDLGAWHLLGSPLVGPLIVRNIKPECVAIEQLEEGELTGFKEVSAIPAAPGSAHAFTSRRAGTDTLLFAEPVLERRAARSEAPTERGAERAKAPAHMVLPEAAANAALHSPSSSLTAERGRAHGGGTDLTRP